MCKIFYEKLYKELSEIFLSIRERSNLLIYLLHTVYRKFATSQPRSLIKFPAEGRVMSAKVKEFCFLRLDLTSNTHRVVKD